jgi:curved DNA-binding protein CbpA
VLGVDFSATEEEIRAAYLALVKLWHPDRNPGDRAAEERFKRINLAYEILRDKERRAEYDQRMHVYRHPSSRTALASRFRQRHVRRKAGFAVCAMAGCCVVAVGLQLAPAPAPMPEEEAKVEDRIPSAFAKLSPRQARDAEIMAGLDLASAHDDRWGEPGTGYKRAHYASMHRSGANDAAYEPPHRSLASLGPPLPSPPQRSAKPAHGAPVAKPRPRLQKPALAQAKASATPAAAMPVRLASGNFGPSGIGGESRTAGQSEVREAARDPTQVEDVLAGGL